MVPCRIPAFAQNACAALCKSGAGNPAPLHLKLISDFYFRDMDADKAQAPGRSKGRRHRKSNKCH